MNKLILINYANKIKRNDIIDFLDKQGIILDDYEVNILYNYIRNDIERMLDNPQGILYEIKEKVSNTTYLKILDLYNKYKYFIN